MIATIETDEVIEFHAALAGVDMEWTRTDAGFGPATLTAAGDDHLAVSSGGMDFSTLVQVTIPHDRVVVQVITEAPDGMKWCGSDAAAGELRAYAPSSAVFGVVPAGSRAVAIIIDFDFLTTAAKSLGISMSLAENTGCARPATDAVTSFVANAEWVAASPELLTRTETRVRLVESAAKALASTDDANESRSHRGFDSSSMVENCLEYANAHGRWQPTVDELCRAAIASESRLRRAFLDVVGLPPTQFFQVRVLSRLRDLLVAADPATTVTDLASSLGLTQFGRVAVRYRAVFGESPSATLRRPHLPVAILSGFERTPAPEALEFQRFACRAHCRGGRTI